MTEYTTGVLSTLDSYAYPALIFFYASITIYLYCYPQHLKAVEITTITVLAVYMLVTHWLYFINPETGHLNELSFQQAKIVQWYILIFIAAFVFFNSKAAIIISALFYSGLAIPEIIFLLDGSVARAPEVTATTLISLISNPVYIACLWAVSLLKKHAYEVQEYAEIMTEAASRDALTNTLNRRGISEVITGYQSTDNPADHTCAVILFDIDFFKKINDTFGHDIGDQTLIDVAKSTQTHLRQSDHLARWGGEEFLIIAPALDLDAAAQLAERLRSDLDNNKSDHLENVTASYGVSLLMPQEAYEDAIKRADKALYEAKTNGRNQVVTQSPTDVTANLCAE